HKKSWSAQANRLPDPKHLEPVPPQVEKLIAVMGRKQSLAFSQVFEQPGGRPTIYVCVPLLMHGARSGYVAGMYDVADLLASALERQVPADYSVSVIADGHELRVFNARAAKTSAIEQTAPVALANVTWLVRLRAAPDDLESLRELVLGFGLLVTVLLA